MIKIFLAKRENWRDEILKLSHLSVSVEARQQCNAELTKITPIQFSNPNYFGSN